MIVFTVMNEEISRKIVTERRFKLFSFDQLMEVFAFETLVEKI